MSKGDPFNFNDIYASMGAENLVKRPMAELKKPAAAAVTPAVSSHLNSLQPGKQPAAAPASAVPTYDLEFLGGNPAKPAAPAAATTHLRPTPGAQASFGFDDLFSGSPAPSQHPPAPAAASNTSPAGGSSALSSSQTVDADPFAAFETVDGAMPVVASAPSTNPVTPNASMADLVTLGGGPASGFVSQDPLPSPPSRAPVAASTPLQPYPPVYDHVITSKPAGSSLQAASGPRLSGDGMYAAQKQDFEPFSQPTHQHHQSYPQPPQHQPWPAAPQSFSQGAGHGAGAHKSAATAARGIASFLTDLGKKAAKAAHEGLKHLEHAMAEGQASKPALGPRGWGAVEAGTTEEMAAMKPSQSRTQGYASFGDSAETGYAGYPSDTDDQGAAKALDIALRIGDLPVEVRGDALAQLQPAMRVMVEEILREQLLLEEEDRASGRGSAGQKHQQAGDASPYNDGQGYQQARNSTGAGSEPAARPQQAPLSAPSATFDLLGVDEDLTSARHPGQGAAAAGAAGAQGASSGAKHDFGDFLSAGAENTPRPAAAAAPAAGLEDGHDFGDFLSHAGPAATPAGMPAPAASQPQHHVDETHDMADFFSGGGQPSAAQSPSAVPRPAAGASAGPPVPAMDLIGDLHSDGLDVSNHQQLYQDVEGHEGEPEIRRQLRAARLAERNAKMRAALAEKLAKDEEEARRKEEQVQLKDQYKQVVEAWKNKHKGNIRGLLGSLHTVLWENSGWVTVSVGDLLDSNQVKKVYMKANLLVHPDKVRQRNGTAEQVAIADMVFDVLKDAWNVFRP